MRVSIVGAGYVGLVSGACLASYGHEVICVDVDAEKVARINRALSPIYEDGLPELLKACVGHTLRATVDLPAAVEETDLTLIAVGTPFNGTEIDLSYVQTAARQIGASLRHKAAHHTVVVKSTVVPGTTDEVVLPTLEDASGKRAGLDFGVGMNPEFLREGEAVADFMNPDRIVLGGIDARTLDTLEELYRPFDHAEIIRTSNRTAEMIKYASNALLSTLISFSNEVGNLCAELEGVDVMDVMRGVHLDKRFSPILADGQRIEPGFTSYLQAGCGFGGSCFPKDVKALIAYGKKSGSPMSLLDAVIGINERQPQQIVRMLERHFSSLVGIRVAVLGLAFKPGTDDVRESPALAVITELATRGSSIVAYDPVAENEARKVLAPHEVTFRESLTQAIQDVDAVVIMTRWNEFLELPEMLDGQAKQPLIVDGRRMLDKHRVSRYEGIGLWAKRNGQLTDMEVPSIHA